MKDRSSQSRRSPTACSAVAFRRLVVTVFLLLATATPVRGQAHVLEVTPRAAAGFFPSKVLRVTTPEGVRLQDSLEDALAGGLTLGVRPVDPLTIELEFLVSDTESSGSTAELATAGASIDEEVTYGYYGAAVRYRLPWPEGRLRSSVVAGVGQKEFDSIQVGTANPFTVSFGGALRLDVPGWPDVRTEVRDYVSSFDPGQLLPGLEKETFVQHDVFWSVGAVVGVF